jgi:8-oxo-dGTP pyrophosphatase MutT (NUDIX family)
MVTPFPEGWQKLSEQQVFSSHWVSIRCEDLVDAKGVHHDWYVTEHPDFVSVFCVTEDGKIVLNRQFKFGCKTWVIEPCAGYVDPGETPLAAAMRELEEETGYVAAFWQHAATLIVSPTSQENRVHIFFATGATQTGTVHREPSEIIEQLVLTPAEVGVLLEHGQANTIASVAVIEMGLRWLDKNAVH